MRLNDSISGDYTNKNITNEALSNLPDLLRKFNESKLIEKSNRIVDTLTTSIKYDGKKQLTISFTDTNKIEHVFSLKVKNKGNYLSVKRKLKLIPIPILFFVYKNNKGIIFNDSVGNLHFITGECQFIWIFIIGGSKEILDNSFEIKK